MSAHTCLRALFLLLFALVSFGSISAHSCTATAQDVFVVGNTATDTACNFNTIQAAIDAATCQAGTRIYLTSEVNYTAQHLAISNKNISLIGRKSGTSCGALTAACGINFPCPTTPLETISGTGHTGDSVITISGTSNVAIQYLTVSDGDAGNKPGGGIDYFGTGTLTLDTSTISDNTSVSGGGIYVQGNGGDATLLINANTQIIYNTATGSDPNGGGGISLQDKATMTMNAPNTWVAFNQAVNGFGGGILAANSDANIGSPGYLFGAAIYANEALNGGGIAMLGAGVRLYTTDPMHPIAVDNNTAYNDGGGIYVIDYKDFYAQLCASDFRITNNIAKEGTGVLTDDDDGGFGTAIGFNTENKFGYCQFANYPSVACDSTQQCSIVHGNVAMDVRNSNSPTNGAALLINYGTSLAARNLDVRSNTGGYALRELGNTTLPAAYTDVYLVNCLFADNAASAELILASGSGTSHLNLDNCTFAHDSIGASRVIAANDTLAFNRNIIDEGSQIAALAFSGNGSNLTAQYNIAGDTSGFPAGLTNMQGQPTFVDVVHGDYRLFYGLQGGELVKSLGIDYAPPVTGDDRDIRGLPRDQPIYSPMFGDRDLGAYEMQGVGDRIFISTFGDTVLLVH